MNPTFSQAGQPHSRDEASSGSAGRFDSLSSKPGETSSPDSVTVADSDRWISCLDGKRPGHAACREVLIGVLPGEGIGPEVTRCALDILGAVAGVTGLRVQTREGGVIGRDSEQACGQTLPSEVIQFCREVFTAGGAILNGPGGGRYVYELRRHLDLFFKISPLQASNGVPGASRLQPEALRDVDILVTRENSGGVYQGEWTSTKDPRRGRVASHSFDCSESQVHRFLHASARLAQMRQGNLAVVWKESGVPSISALWRDCAAAAAEAHGVQWTMVDVDLMAYRLIQDAPMFDVIAAPNLFGDVLADLGAALLGSRGVSYSGNFTEHGDAVYQTNHGAAYHLAGADQANPAGQILSLVMMLRESFGLRHEADAIADALRSVWRSGWRTVDVVTADTTRVSTRKFATRVAECAADLARERAPQGAEVE